VDVVSRVRGQAAVAGALLWIAACAANLPVPTSQTEPPLSATAPVSSHPRAPTSFAYHFNRNALTASVLTPSGDLLALTDTGNLLLFDTQTFAVRAERFPRSPAACLGPASASAIIVGLDDGRIVEVAIPSLTIKRVGAIDGSPAWIGRAPSGKLLIAYGLAPENPAGGRRRDPCYRTRHRGRIACCHRRSWRRNPIGAQRNLGRSSQRRR
jgi:hypothetical protein